MTTVAHGEQLRRPRNGGVAARRALRSPPSAADRKAATVDLLNVLLPTRRSFDVRFWDGTVLPAPQQPAHATVVLNHEYSLSRMLHFPLDVSVGEAYLRGDFDIEGDVATVAALGDDLELTPTTLVRVLALLPAPALLPVLPMLPVLPEPILLLEPVVPLVERPLGFEELAILSRTWCVA